MAIPFLLSLFCLFSRYHVLSLPYLPEVLCYLFPFPSQLDLVPYSPTHFMPSSQLLDPTPRSECSKLTAALAPFFNPPFSEPSSSAWVLVSLSHRFLSTVAFCAPTGLIQFSAALAHSGSIMQENWVSLIILSCRSVELELLFFLRVTLLPDTLFLLLHAAPSMHPSTSSLSFAASNSFLGFVLQSTVFSSCCSINSHHPSARDSCIDQKQV